MVNGHSGSRHGGAKSENVAYLNVPTGGIWKGSKYDRCLKGSLLLYYLPVKAARPHKGFPIKSIVLL